jgi:hypothetical protein
MVKRPLHKEISYFSRFYSRGPNWYRGHFPVLRGHGGKNVTFEASPSYLFHPLAAERAAAEVPGARLIVLLRDPVKRAFSHYRMSVFRGVETLSFEDALEAEEDRIGRALEKLGTDPSFDCDAVWDYSYQARGYYLDQLKRWIDAFGRDSVLVLPSEDMFARPQETTNLVCGFLGLPGFDRLDTTPSSYPSFPRSGGPKLDPITASKLAKQFQQANDELADYLGVRYSWR